MQAIDAIELELLCVTNEKETSLSDGSSVQLSDLQKLDCPYRKASWFYHEFGKSIPIEPASAKRLERAYRAKSTSPIELYIDSMGSTISFSVDFPKLTATQQSSNPPNTISLQRGHHASVEEEQKADIVGFEYRHSGDIWEDELLGIISSRGDRLLQGTASPGARSSDAKIDASAFIRHLETLKPREDGKSTATYFYQPTLPAVPSLYEAFGLDRSEIVLSDSYPDLIEVEFKEISQAPHCTRASWNT